MGQCQYQLAMVTLDIIQFLFVTIAVTMLNQTDIFQMLLHQRYIVSFFVVYIYTGVCNAYI